ncbi:hypothetical protein BRADI_4g22163v3 [Brachypodium distachyon]|uniref:Uncharacterized protein n=1 Tax=Brachypodium distachyon TaxID=15368 RepID=A0A2K2CPF0_BRADI|nr:hypothetical protein BRADI_4g22163v3 [Brachypodium distachyon]PNT63905.1 hypothetical protein BRADI_4g22163v3 [Brachypodium distachyon]
MSHMRTLQKPPLPRLSFHLQDKDRNIDLARPVIDIATTPDIVSTSLHTSINMHLPPRSRCTTLPRPADIGAVDTMLLHLLTLTASRTCSRTMPSGGGNGTGKTETRGSPRSSPSEGRELQNPCFRQGNSAKAPSSTVMIEVRLVFNGAPPYRTRPNLTGSEQSCTMKTHVTAGTPTGLQQPLTFPQRGADRPWATLTIDLTGS